MVRELDPLERSGVEIVTQHWENRGLTMAGLRMEDGSGLARADSIRPLDLAKILWLTRRGPQGEAYFQSLNAAHEGRIRWKGGAMSRVRAFEEAAVDALGQGLVPGPIHPSIGQEAVAAGEDAVPLMVDILSRRRFREGDPADCALLPVHAMRVLESEQAVVAGVPSFRAMTKLPRKRINRQLISPHAPMPNMQLTLKEIADILAFVEALRREAAGEPKAAPTPRKKPIYPSPS